MKSCLFVGEKKGVNEEILQLPSASTLITNLFEHQT